MNSYRLIYESHLNNKRDSAHLHIYRKKNNPKKIKLDRQTDSSTQQEESRVSIEGSRIINVDKLQVYIDDLTKHSLHCGGSIVLCGERRDGLASSLVVTALLASTPSL